MRSLHDNKKFSYQEHDKADLDLLTTVSDDVFAAYVRDFSGNFRGKLTSVVHRGIQ
jgi:hypothetical protein